MVSRVTTGRFKALLQLANFTLGPDATLNTEIHTNLVRIKAPNSVSASKRKHQNQINHYNKPQQKHRFATASKIFTKVGGMGRGLNRFYVATTLALSLVVVSTRYLFSWRGSANHPDTSYHRYTFDLSLRLRAVV